MTCATKKFLEKFSESDLRRLGCIFHLYDDGEREFTSVSLWSAIHLLCNCDAVRLETVQRFLQRMRENNIINMKRTVKRWMVYELNMQNKLVADLFSKYQAVRRGEIYEQDDVDDGVCKYELLVLRQYWDGNRIPMRLMERILKKGV